MALVGPDTQWTCWKSTNCLLALLIIDLVLFRDNQSIRRPRLRQFGSVKLLNWKNPSLHDSSLSHPLKALMVLTSPWNSLKWQAFPLAIHCTVDTMSYLEYRTVKIFGGKKAWWIRTVGSLVEKTLVFGELKSICIGNVMEIVKISDKTWLNAVIYQICQSFFTANVFYCTVTVD